MKPVSFTCEAIREQIDGLSQKGLRAARRSGPIQEHVQQCISCRSYFERALTLGCHLDSWQIPEPNKNLCTRVMTEIAQMERDRRVSLTTLLKQGATLLNVRLRVPAAAAALLTAALVVSVAFNIKGIHQTATVTMGDTSSDNPGIVSTPTSDSTALYLSTDQRNKIGPYMSSAALAPSTYVVILGAPPSYSVNGLEGILSGASAIIVPPDEESLQNINNQQSAKRGVQL